MKITQFIADTAKINPNDIGYDAVKNADSALGGLLTVVYSVAGIICVLIIVIAGYFYVVSNGNPSEVKKAKDAIMGAVIGLVVVLMAFVITQFVLGRF